MVVKETEAAPAESTGPTVNIQTTEAAKAEPVHRTAALTVKAMCAGGEIDHVVTLQEGIGGDSLVDATENSSEQLQQCASVQLVAEKQPAETQLGLDESMSGGFPESAALTFAAEKEYEEVIDEEGDGAGVEQEVSKGEHGGFRFTVAPAYIRDCEREEKQPSTEEEHSQGEAAESCLEASDEELAGFKNAGERKHTEVHGKRVQFSNEVQYFKEQEFLTELEDFIEEVDEEIDECSPAEDGGEKTFADVLKPLPFEKEKYYYAQTDSSEDEMERTEEEDGKKEELEEEYGEEELKLAEDSVDKKREDDTASEEVKEEEIVQTEVLEVEEIEEQDQKSSPHRVTQTEPLNLTHPPPAVSQSEVTLHQLQWPLPCNLTSTLHSCRHNLPLIIKGKTRPKAWICVATC